MMMYGFGGWWWLMTILMVAFWGLVIWAIVYVISRVLGNDRRGHGSSLEVLKRRYAAGEISREEFETKRRDIL